MRTKFDWRAAYFHIISLVAIIILLFALISVGHGILRLAFPKLSMNPYEWEQVESFEAYKRSASPEGPKARPAPVNVTDTLTRANVSDEQLHQSWEEHRVVAVEGQRRTGLWELLESLVSAIVVVPIFWWHRRAVKRLKPLEDSPE